MVASSTSERTQRVADLVAALIGAVLTSTGRLPAERRAAFAGQPMEGAPGAFAEKVRHHANTVTDEDIDVLRRQGMDEDAIFELTIACAVGAAHSKLQAGLTELRYDP